VFSVESQNGTDLATRDRGRFSLPACPEIPAPAELLTAVLDLRPFPVFLLRPDRSAAWMNRAAQSWLLEGSMTVSRHGKLRLREAAAQERLGKILKGLAGKSANSEAEFLAFEARDGTPRILRIEAMPVPAFPEDDAAGVWFEISVRSGDCGLRISPERLASTLHLTPAEAALASALAEGLSLQDYAERERLKIATVRWHLQNIFNRTGARSQSGLIRMMVSLFA
jgi:DNA-binding CsgD family transcriptional regulator